MSDNPFAPPAPPGESIPWKELAGALLLIEPKSFETGIQTSYGASDAVRADVAALDGPLGGTEFNDTLVFPKVLQGQLKSRTGQIVLGRLGQGQAKPGQSAPWMLEEATPQDVELGKQWLARKQPQPAAAAPAAAASGAPEQAAGQQWQQPATQQTGDVPF